ncbi:hypothetical protein [Alicyclobacillus fodiniaquatilis]|uniref:Uncharacterized protein n=1 Tax=Alicyclobacillus fodiniaquatilis TaxID=1661150 RepID=A0ABW4JQ02_9BACL
MSRLYLYGISLGGGAVLQLASERDDVKAVAVDSPFVGFDATIKWFDKLGK